MERFPHEERSAKVPEWYCPIGEVRVNRGTIDLDGVLHFVVALWRHIPVERELVFHEVLRRVHSFLVEYLVKNILGNY